MNRIKQLRKELDISQKELCAKVGITSQQLLSLYESEKNTPSIEMWLKMAEFFDVDIEYLTGKSNIRKKSKQQFAEDDIDIAFYEGYKDLNEEDKEILRNTLKAFLRNKGDKK